MLENQDNLKDLCIRVTKEQDVPVLYSLIKELSVYEKMTDQVVTDEQAVRKTLFGSKAYAEARLAIWKGEPVGMVIFFHNYSTFLGRPGLYIEDLYVNDSFRGLGIGQAIFMACVQIALERNCGRMEWSVLNWNPARQFYEKLGAYSLDDWIVYRLDREAMGRLMQ